MAPDVVQTRLFLLLTVGMDGFGTKRYKFNQDGSCRQPLVPIQSGPDIPKVESWTQMDWISSTCVINSSFARWDCLIIYTSRSGTTFWAVKIVITYFPRSFRQITTLQDTLFVHTARSLKSLSRPCSLTISSQMSNRYTRIFDAGWFVRIFQRGWVMIWRWV